MSGAFHKLISDAETMLALEPEELGSLILKYLEKQPVNSYELNLVNFVNRNARGDTEEIKQALVEGWSWLVRENLIAPKPGMESWFFVTRRGAELARTDQIMAYRKKEILSRRNLHRRIADKVWGVFVRGDLDTAVFQSFKELEIAVRDSSGLLQTDVGIDLMRRAFRPEHGPLADKCAPLAEQEALMHLMAGAIGSYKNPHSHRSVSIELEEAAEMITLASHLLKIVDKRHSN